MQDLPVFIGGFRSGTTLLVNLLGLHPDLTPWFETRELCELLRWMHVLKGWASADFERTYCAPPVPQGFAKIAVAARMRAQLRETFARLSGAQASGKGGHERYPLGNDYLRYSPQQAGPLLRDWYEASGEGGDYERLAVAGGSFITSLAALQCGKHGAPAWINKTPEISRFARELRACLGPCRVIYLVGDGIQVVASGQRLGWGGIDTLAFNWKGLLERTRAAMVGHEACYLELRYEQLLRDPVATLDRVLAFCGQTRLGVDMVARYTRYYGSGAFDTARLADRGGLDAGQLAVFNAVAGDMQASLGYPAC